MTPPAPHPFAGEARLVARAVPRRVAEFQAGRAAARAALAALGLPGCEILAHDAGDPAWPAGTVGSIAHTADWAVAVAARADGLSGIGVDLEDDTPLDAELVDLVCRPEERSASPPPGFDALTAATLTFVAKEAVYKALFPVERRFIGFDEVSVSFEPAFGRFTARRIGGPPTDGLAPRVAPGLFHRGDSLICAVCYWR